MSMARKIIFDNWSKEKLLHEYKELLKRKKFGIVWEDKPEEVAEQCKTSLPVLKDEKSKSFSTDKNGINHIFIEGDNYHALSVLSYTHKKKIDVIYIDPPYNKGNKDFKYNDTFVEKDDAYRHSKWLSFMSKRLRLAKNLMNNAGLIFISIDDNEIAQLRLLCDEVFREENFVGHITIQGTANESNEGVMFQNVTEYLLCYAKNKSLAKINKIDAVKEGWRSLNDAPSGLSTRKQMGYTIYYNVKTQDIIPKIDYDINGDFSDLENIYKDDEKLLLKGYIAIRPKARNGVAWRWRWGMETLIERKNELKFRQNRNREWVVEFGQSGFNAPRDYQEFGTGTTELKRLFDGNEIFNKPKSTELIKWILEVGTNKSAIVLDFFAGSGTTGHAVLGLNNEDGGSRQFILCTNNENNNGNGGGIAESVCYPRIKKVIEGYKDLNGKSVAGLGGNLQYCTTKLIGNIKTDNDKRVFTSFCREMLCLSESTFDEVASKKGLFAIFENQKQMTGIIFDEDAISDFRKEARKHKKPIVVYVFSYDHTYNEEDFEDLENLKVVKPIPEVILNVYRKIYKELYKPRNL